jgi:putative membrane protein (TIGR04086 family)
MKTAFSDVQWRRVLLGGVIPTILTMVLVFLVILVYVFGLAAQARGQPDRTQIERFVSLVHWFEPVLAILLTVSSAAWVAHKAQRRTGLHGLLVGLVVAILLPLEGLAFGATLGLRDLVSFVLTIAAGWLGSTWSSREKA